MAFKNSMLFELKCFGCRARLLLIVIKHTHAVNINTTTTPAIDPPIITMESVALNFSGCVELVLKRVVTVTVEDEPMFMMCYDEKLESKVHST